MYTEGTTNHMQTKQQKESTTNHTQAKQNTEVVDTYNKAGAPNSHEEDFPQVPA